MPCADTLLPDTRIEAAGLERVRFFPRQLLTADDLRTEQEYFREKLRRHNRFLHGWGVVCGLEVRANPEAGPLVVTVCPGYALAPQGDEIYVASAARLDLNTCLRRSADPCPPAVAIAPAAKMMLAVQIRYAECASRPVRTMPAGCGCDESGCEYSRLRDGFELRCTIATDTKPPTHLPPTLCQVHKTPGNALPCLPAATDCWVELARVTIVQPPAGAVASASIDDTMIDNGTRRLLASTGMVQDQVIRCCCK